MVETDRDTLTGLWTRTGVLRLIEASPGTTPGGSADAQPWVSIALLDIDGFKAINDRHGHAAGDQALVEVARRLESCAGDRAVVARWGGDEFAILSGHAPAACTELFEMLQGDLHRGVPVDDQSLPISISGGSAWLDLSDLDASLRNADHAVYQAKSYGGARFVLHGPLTDQYVEERRELLDRMARMQDEIARLVAETHTDALTGIGNRRALDGHVEALERRAPPAPINRCVLFLDLDRFHELNRLQGDDSGDDALRDVARTLRETCRDSDVVVPQEQPVAFRKGGEEFVVVAPVHDVDGALALAERLCRAIEDLGIPHGGPGQPVLTTTIGVAVTGAGRDLTTALRRAGIAMGRLKDQGRRGVVGFMPENEEPQEHERPHETPLN